jgi:hypothetical protein
MRPTSRRFPVIPVVLTVCRMSLYKDQQFQRRTNFEVFSAELPISGKRDFPKNRDATETDILAVVNSTDFSLGTKYSFPSLELFAAELPWSSMSIRQKSNADSLLGNVGQEWFSKRKSEQLYVFPRSEFDYALNDLGMSLSGSGNPNVFGGEMLWSSMSFRYHHFSVTHSLLSCRGHRSPDHSFQKTDSQPIGPSDLPRSSLAFQSPKHTIRC